MNTYELETSCLFGVVDYRKCDEYDESQTLESQLSALLDNRLISRWINWGSFLFTFVLIFDWILNFVCRVLLQTTWLNTTAQSRNRTKIAAERRLNIFFVSSSNYKSSSNCKINFSYSYELNNDRFNSYKKKRSKTTMLPMLDQLKSYWDNLQPKLSNFIAKQLRGENILYQSKKKSTRHGIKSC